MDTILVANAGSSSVKFEVFGVDQAGGLSGQLEGKIEGVGTKPHLTAKSAEGKVLVERTYANETVPHVPAALHTAGSWLRDELHIHPIAVGHRVVHGGPEFDQPVLVTEDVLRRLERYIPLAPVNHGQSAGAAPGRVLRYRLPSQAPRRRRLLRDP
jgi:acetate kinase